MSSLTRTILALFFVLTLAGSAGATPAAEETVYGAGVQSTETVKVSELLDNPDRYVGKTVRVEGAVVDVCPKRGCWMEIAGDRESETLRVKVDDGVIVFPKEAKGRRALAEGVFTRIELTPEQATAFAKHLAEEKGEPFDEKSAANLPRVMYQIKGTGAIIR